MRSTWMAHTVWSLWDPLGSLRHLHGLHPLKYPAPELRLWVAAAGVAQQPCQAPADLVEILSQEAVKMILCCSIKGRICPLFCKFYSSVSVLLVRWGCGAVAECLLQQSSLGCSRQVEEGIEQGQQEQGQEQREAPVWSHDRLLTASLQEGFIRHGSATDQNTETTEEMQEADDMAGWGWGWFHHVDPLNDQLLLMILFTQNVYSWKNTSTLLKKQYPDCPNVVVEQTSLSSILLQVLHIQTRFRQHKTKMEPVSKNSKALAKYRKINTVQVGLHSRKPNGKQQQKIQAPVLQGRNLNMIQYIIISLSDFITLFLKNKNKNTISRFGSLMYLSSCAPKMFLWLCDASFIWLKGFWFTCKCLMV